MNAKSVLLALFAGMLASLPLGAQRIVRDTTAKSLREYTDEVGFYQKANRDLGDPRFMFSDKKTGIDFGIGGVIKAVGTYGICGAVSTTSLRPAGLAVPTDNSPAFYAKMSDSYLYAKARAKLGRFKLTAYLKFSGTDDLNAKLSQAYLSLNDFSIGIIPTFFSDLEYGALSTGMAISSLVDMEHFLVGYTQRFNNGLSLGAAIELPDVNLDHYTLQSGLGSNYQPVPDLALRLKYKWDKGHLQLAGLFRYLTYWAFDYPPQYSDSGENRHTPAYGVAFSGGYRLCDKVKLSWDMVGGRGIGSYIKPFSNLYLDLAQNKELKSGLKSMSAVPTVNGSIIAEINWSPKFTSSFVFYDTHVFDSPEYTIFSNFKNSMGGFANFFWNIDEYAYCGIEYMFLTKRLYANSGDADFGQAHRIALVMSYSF